MNESTAHQVKVLNPTLFVSTIVVGDNLSTEAYKHGTDLILRMIGYIIYNFVKRQQWYNAICLFNITK